MDAEQSRRRVGSHQVDDERTPISTLCDEFFIAEAFHQHGPGAGDALGTPAGRAWLSRKAVTWHRGNHQMERVRGTPAVGCWIGQRLDDLQLLDDRAWPPMRDDERQRILVHGTHMDEMNVEAIDFGHEVRQGVEPCLALAPVIVGPPIAREFLYRRELHALGFIRHGFTLGPTRRRDAPAQFVDVRLRKVDGDGADLSQPDGDVADMTSPLFYPMFRCGRTDRVDFVCNIRPVRVCGALL